MRWTTIFLALLAVVRCPAQARTSENDHPQWEYNRYPDKMTGKDTLAAAIESSDGMYLSIERHPEGVTTAYVFFAHDSHKLFFCSLSGCTVRVRFDGGKIEYWSAEEPNNGSSTSLHFIQVTKLISRLRSAHRVIIEVPIFQEGPMPFEFVVGGLIWPPPLAKDAPKAAESAGKTEVTPPACFYTPQPPYSEQARAANFQGHVIGHGTVTLEGSIENIQIEKSPGLGLDDSVMKTLREWKCKPASGPNGQPIPFTLPFDIKFQVESGSPVGLTLSALQKRYPKARCFYGDDRRPETVEFCIVEPDTESTVLLFGKLSVIREVVTFGGHDGLVSEIKATLSNKMLNVNKYLQEILPPSDPFSSSWQYNGEQISITYKDENTTEMKVRKF